MYHKSTCYLIVNVVVTLDFFSMEGITKLFHTATEKTLLAAWYIIVYLIYGQDNGLQMIF